MWTLCAAVEANLYLIKQGARKVKGRSLLPPQLGARFQTSFDLSESPATSFRIDSVRNLLNFNLDLTLKYSNAHH